MASGAYLRYVALGDSQTEGLGDGDELGGFRGWADRLAESIATFSPDLLYANLAVRGRVAAEVWAEQLPAALAMKPDLATVVAGVNDLLRPRWDQDAVMRHLEAIFAALTEQGARVATITYPDIAKVLPISRFVSSRVEGFNDRIRAAAARYDVVVVETAHYPVVTDPRLWSFDRLHASPLGHERIAAAIAHALELPGSSDDWTRPLPTPAVIPHGLRRAAAELHWFTSYFAPWLFRRLRGASSGDGRKAKRPELLPLKIVETVPSESPQPTR